MKDEQIQELLKSLRDASDPHLKASLLSDGAFRCCLVASLSKSISVATKLNGSDEDKEFFGLASLRSVCEELIVFSFVGKLSKADRDILMHAIALRSIDERLGKQSKFFKHVKREQMLLNPQAMVPLRAQITANLEGIHKKHNWTVGRHSTLPSTAFMARKTDLQWLYDYVFAGTSSLVHFDPGQLMRMGWGPLGEGPMVFDIKNFNVYYQRFGEFYSLLLLIGLFKRTLFSKEFQNDVRQIIEAIEAELMDTLRWPELITFEEMNQPPPNEVFQILYHVMSKEKQRASLFQWALLA